MTKRSTSTKVTPYTCQTLYQEIEQIKSKRRTLSGFLLRTDLIFISNFVGIGEQLTEAQVVNLCISKILKVDALYNATHLYFQQYMEGIGTINSINKHLASLGQTSLQDEIVKANLSTSSILTFTHLSVTGRMAERNNLDPVAFKEELLNEYALSNTLTESKAFETINSKVSEIDLFVSELKQAHRTYDATATIQALDKVKEGLEKLDSNSPVSPNELKEVETKALSLLEDITNTGAKFDKIEEGTIRTLNGYSTIIDEAVRKISQEKERTDRIGRFIDTKNREGKERQEGLERVTNALKQSLTEVEDLVNQAPVEDLLSIAKEFVETLQGIQGEVKGQALMIAEAEGKLKSLSEGAKVLNEVVAALNGLMRQDILLGLSNTQEGFTHTAHQIEALGDKYRKWRELDQ